MEKKKNSIEWLVQELNRNIHFIPNVHHWDKIRDIIQQAKAMHEEEQENTWEIAWDESSKFDYCKNKYNGGFQQYYNETFGGQDNE